MYLYRLCFAYVFFCMYIKFLLEMRDLGFVIMRVYIGKNIRENCHSLPLISWNWTLGVEHTYYSLFSPRQGREDCAQYKICLYCFFRPKYLGSSNVSPLFEKTLFRVKVIARFLLKRLTNHLERNLNSR